VKSLEGLTDRELVVREALLRHLVLRQVRLASASDGGPAIRSVLAQLNTSASAWAARGRAAA
jgi:hypothetical protein